jgi:hypothetical protein
LGSEPNDHSVQVMTRSEQGASATLGLSPTAELEAKPTAV